MSHASEILTALRSELRATTAADLPAIIGEIEAVKAEAFALLVVPIAPAQQPDQFGDDDRLLTAEQVGERLGQSARWVRDHQTDLPRVKLPGRALRFSERRLETLIKRRSYA